MHYKRLLLLLQKIIRAVSRYLVRATKVLVVSELIAIFYAQHRKS